MKIILEFFFFSTLRKITVGEFVNQLIKKFQPYNIHNSIEMLNTYQMFMLTARANWSVKFKGTVSMVIAVSSITTQI